MSLLKEARRIENMLLYLGKQYLLELSVRKPNDEVSKQTKRRIVEEFIKLVVPI